MKPETADEVEAEFDPRLADVWLAIFSSGVDIEDIREPLACFVRIAYLQGYQDALSEPEVGALYRKLGLTPPRRRPRPTDRKARR